MVLKIRLDLLWSNVNLFVISEANLTFSGLPKELALPNFLERYPRYKEKIIYIPILDTPQFAGDWEREAYQRFSLGKGLHGIKEDDYIMLSDVDEIPCPGSIGRLGVFKQQLFVFYLNTIAPYLWEGTVAITGKQYLKNPNLEQWRANRTKMRRVWEGGWHLTYIGGSDMVKRKLESFSDSHIHDRYAKHELDTKIETLSWPFGRGEVQLQPMPSGWRPPFIPVKHLPDYVSYFYDKSRVI